MRIAALTIFLSSSLAVPTIAAAEREKTTRGPQALCGLPGYFCGQVERGSQTSQGLRNDQCKDANGDIYHEPFDELVKWIQPTSQPSGVRLEQRPEQLYIGDLEYQTFFAAADLAVGEYQIKFTSTNSQHCNGYWWYWTVGVIPGISSDTQDLWWFEGETPPNYATKTTLKAKGTRGPYRWRIIKGSSYVEFPGGLQDITTTEAKVVIKAKAATPTKYDVLVTVEENNQESRPLELRVRTPHRVIKMKPNHQPMELNGYRSWIYYKVKDQFDEFLPGPLPCNEKFTGPVKNDYPGATWTRTPAWGSDVCQVGVEASDKPETMFNDRILGQVAHPNEIPISMNPQKPLGEVKVHNFPGGWRFGSAEIGKGTLVFTNRWQRFQDHADHTHIVTPVNVNKEAP